ncbi:MAG: hypothetical protein HS126_22045 [Anaerolineales bacterium]|nr:hypothetical protein [Anaerolineales bacterium]
MLQTRCSTEAVALARTEFKQDYETFLKALELDPQNNNFFSCSNRAAKKASRGVLPLVRGKAAEFYKMAGRLLQKHVTGQGRDEAGRWRSLDPDVPRNNAMFKDWYKDYDRIRDAMAVNARERGEDEIESFVRPAGRAGQEQRDRGARP